MPCSTATISSSSVLRMPCARRSLSTSPGPPDRADRKMLHAGDEVGVQVRRLARQHEALELLEHLLEEDPQADPGHRVTDAVVRANPEGQVPSLGGAPDVEPVRIG